MKNTGERQVGTKLSDIEPKHVQRYEFAQKYCVDKDVLDAACGCGYGSNILSKEAKSVLGVDYSPEAIDYAQKFWGAKNITFRQSDLNSDLATLGDFDVIISLETVEHLDTPIIQTCRKFYQILRPSGVLILSHPEKQTHPGKEAEENPLKKPTLLKAMARNIQKAVYHLYKRNFSILWSFIKDKILKKAGNCVSYHKHFNIDGEYIRNSLTDIGFQIRDEWYQPGRFYFPYHIIVAEKNG